MKHQRSDDARIELCKTSFGQKAVTGAKIWLWRALVYVGTLHSDTVHKVNLKKDSRFVRTLSSTAPDCLRWL